MKNLVSEFKGGLVLPSARRTLAFKVVKMAWLQEASVMPDTWHWPSTLRSRVAIIQDVTEDSQHLTTTGEIV